MGKVTALDVVGIVGHIHLNAVIDPAVGLMLALSLQPGQQAVRLTGFSGRLDRIRWNEPHSILLFRAGNTSVFAKRPHLTFPNAPLEGCLLNRLHKFSPPFQYTTDSEDYQRRFREMTR